MLRSLLRGCSGLLLLVSLQAPAAAPPAPLPDGVTPGPSYAGISEYRLDNGLQVLLYPDASKPRTLVNVTYLVGSRHENYGETGMAHLLEHLLFKGTPEFRNLDQEFGKRGMQVNGTTSADRTNYYEVFEANADNLDWALTMEASRMTKSFIDKSDLDSEMTVVRNEMENGENSPFQVSYKTLLALAYQWHNYGNSTIGARSDVENVPIERLQAFYRQWYQPDNAVLLVAGSFDRDSTLNLIAQRFGAIEKPQRRLPTLYTVEPAQDGQRSAVVRRIGGSPLLLAAYHTPGGGHPDAPAVKLLALVLGDEQTGRLREQLVDPGLAAEAGAFTGDNRDSGQLLVYAQLTQAQDRNLARRTLNQTIESVASKPVDATEFERARLKYRNQLKSALDDVSGLGLALSEYIALGDWRLFFWEMQQLERVKLEDVNRVATTYLKTTNRSMVQFIPAAAVERVEVAAAPPPAELLAKLEPEQVTAIGESIALDPAALEQRIQRIELRPGLKLVLLPKETRNDAVNFSLRLRFGDEAHLRGKADAADALGDLLLRGTQKLDRLAFDDALARTETEMSANGGLSSLSISGRSTRANLAASLRLAFSALREPLLDSAELETWRKETLASIESREHDPQARVSEALRELTNAYPPDHALAFRSDADRKKAVEALKIEDVREYHQQFVSAQTADVVVVGDFAPDDVKAEISSALAEWTESQFPYVRIPEQLATRTGEKREIDTPDKANAFFIAMQPLALNDADPDYPALLIANHVFGDGGMENRLMVRLRQKEGWSYGAGSALYAGPVEAVGSWLVYALTAPENARKVLAATREELERLLKDGLTEAELKSAQDGWLKERRVSWADDARLAGLLLNQAEYDRDLSVSIRLEQQVAALTMEQVNAAARRLLKPDSLNLLIAGDLRKVNGAPSAE